MTLVPVHLERFGGINLRDDPAEVGLNAAIDLLDVDLGYQGRLARRPGATAFTTGSVADGALAVYRKFDGTTHVIAEDNATAFRAITTAGSVVASSTAITGNSSPCSMVNFAAPGSNYMYCNTSSGDVRRWDGSAWSTPAGVPASIFVTAQVGPVNNRLVVVDSSNQSRVKFSNNGAPETFSTNDYVDLSPGDGEPITGLCAWGDYVLAFKRTKFFVFYGNSVDSTGNPIFNYRTVDGGVGAWSFYGNVAPGREGVYFLARDGVYLTSGGPARKISDLIDPYFRGETLPFFGESPYLIPDGNTQQVSVLQDRVLIGLQGNTWVYYPATGQWSLWTEDIISAVDISASGVPRTVYTSDTATDAAYFNESSNVNASGASFTGAQYRSGFGDLGYPGQEKVIRETELTGTGAPSFAWSRDYGAMTTSSTATVTLGTSPAVAKKLHRKSQDGELFSWKLAGSAAWLVDRITPFVRDVRGPAETTT